MDKVPIVDMSEIGTLSDYADNTANWNYVAGQIREGLGDIGFVYLKNHGIDKELVCTCR